MEYTKWLETIHDGLPPAILLRRQRRSCLENTIWLLDMSEKLEEAK